MPRTTTFRRRFGRVLIPTIFAAVPLSAAAVLGISYLAFASVPPVPVPPQNPITEEKRVLGKILFFEEQLSSSNTVACATCHTMSAGGGENRVARNAGPDLALNTADDILGSFGVPRADEANDYVRDPAYRVGPQITGRAANSPINAAFSAELFWDGRARSSFSDPVTGTQLISLWGAPESQAVGPLVNSVEMAHEGVVWADVTSKLQRVQPLDLAADLPPDVAAVLASNPDYPELFRRAFGDTAITPTRIAFAIATYERTLISDQTPYDHFIDGDPTALTVNQQAGLVTFNNDCQICHLPNLFHDGQYHNLGLRPPAEDPGRMNVTGLNSDRGKFRTPGLRNVGLKKNYMHNGMFTNLLEVVRFYRRAPGAPAQFTDNRDPRMPGINFTAAEEGPLVDFMLNGLTDQRVLNEEFPFDRPTLFSERTDLLPLNMGGGMAGLGGVTPKLVVQDPPVIGNLDFRVIVDDVRTSAVAQLAMSTMPPVGGQITASAYYGPITTSSTGVGLGTIHWPLTAGSVFGGQTVYVQWMVEDAAAVGGVARSNVVRVVIGCPRGGCPVVCGTSDFNGDGDFGTDADIEAFFACLAGNCCATCFAGGSDFNGDGDFGTDADIESFFRVLAGGAC